MTPEAFHQQHRDFLNKYRSGKSLRSSLSSRFIDFSHLAKAKLESQLQLAHTHELTNGGDMSNIMKRVRISSTSIHSHFLVKF